MIHLKRLGFGLFILTMITLFFGCITAAVAFIWSRPAVAAFVFTPAVILGLAYSIGCDEYRR